MIVTYQNPKSTAEEYFYENLPYIVMAIQTEEDIKKYWIFSDAIPIPMVIDASECIIIDNATPNRWLLEGELMTYPKGLSDGTNIRYVMWDNDYEYPIETANARHAFFSEYKMILGDYIKRHFGSIKKYLDYKLDEKYTKSIILHEERGYDMIDKNTILPPTLESISLQEIVNDIDKLDNA